MVITVFGLRCYVVRLSVCPYACVLALSYSGYARIDHAETRTRRNLQAQQMDHCCVVFCSIDWRYKERYLRETGKVIHFYKFPVEPDKRKKWIIAIRRDEGRNFKVFTINIER